MRRAVALVAVAVLGAGRCAPAAAQTDTAPATDSVRTFRVTQTTVVDRIPRNAGVLHLWIPVPRTRAAQQVTNVRVDAPGPWTFVTDADYGNRFVRVDLARPIPRRVTVTMTLDARRQAYRPLAQRVRSSTRSGSPKQVAVPVDDSIAGDARRVTAGARTSIDRARRLYDHLVETIRADTLVVGWGDGDPVRVHRVRAGNCTDIHALFIAEARAAGLPTRFIAGGLLPPGSGAVTVYHAWAEFYASGRGWVPVDASHARQFPARRNDLFGGLPADRLELTEGRSIRLPGASGSPQNYVTTPVAEVDGRPHATVSSRIVIANTTAARPATAPRSRR